LKFRAEDLGYKFNNSAVEINELQQQIISFYAEKFTGGNKT
jgi:hypothetical protein